MHQTQHNYNYVILFCLMFSLTGCASTSQRDLVNTSQDETMQDAVTALGSVAGALSDQPLDETQVKQVAQQLRSDEEAQTAVKAIADSFDTKAIKIKYSPVTGKRYSADMEYDPETGVKLLPLE